MGRLRRQDLEPEDHVDGTAAYAAWAAPKTKRRRPSGTRALPPRRVAARRPAAASSAAAAPSSSSAAAPSVSANSWLKVRTKVEAQLHEEGLENRWYTAKVLGVPADGVVKVRFDELLAEEGAGKLVQVVPVADVRPEPPDETEEVRKAAWLDALHDGTLCEAYKDDAWWPSIVRKVPSSRRGQATVFVDFQGFESDVNNETGWRNATLSLAEIRPRWVWAATGRWAVEHD